MNKNDYLELRKKLINYLWKNHPYPKDIFIKEGKEARLGYEICIREIIKFFEEKFEE